MELKIRSPITVILLSIVTCGIYYLYWVWVTNRQINQLRGDEVFSDGLCILSLFCAPVAWYMWYKWDLALKEIAPARGVQYNNNFILWIVLCFVGVGPCVMEFQIQDTINTIYGRSNPNG